MQAILTKYLGPTDHRGSRIAAWCDGGRLTIPFPYGKNDEDAFRMAAEALRDKLFGPDGHLIAGATPEGYVFVFCPDPFCAIVR